MWPTNGPSQAIESFMPLSSTLLPSRDCGIWTDESTISEVSEHSLSVFPNKILDPMQL